MSTSQHAVRRHEYHLLSIVDAVDETDGARSLILEVPRHLRETFSYQPGQFLTVRLRLGMDRHIRCYSMSSSPALDDTLRITIKRVESGLVSNWINNTLRAGYKLEAMPPAGDFVLTDADDDRDIVALCSGSGITPVISIVKTALATTQRSVRLFYANQTRDAVIFASELDALVEQHPGRLELVHHIYDDAGYVDTDAVLSFLGDRRDVDVYLCGSKSFTATVNDALAQTDLPAEAVRTERFTLDASLEASSGPAQAGPDRDTIVASSETTSVSIRIRRALHEVEYQKGQTILQTARRASLTPPYACESGICAACMGMVEDGRVVMPGHHETLTPDELEAGWVLTCQALPVSPSVTIAYPD